MNGRHEELVHPAPWEPRELHLGPADNCYTCGTWTDPTPAELDQALLEILEADVERRRDGRPSVLSALVLFLIVAGLVAWDIWRSLP